MRFTILLYACFAALLTPHGRAHADTNVPEALAVVDLSTSDGVAAVNGKWRYSDVELVRTQHRAPDANGQPTGEVVDTWDYTPHAGVRDFDDSQWAVIEPSSLTTRRGHGRISFNWYRISITVPEHIADVALDGADAVFDTTLDDYAEVWVDGELARLTGQNGGSVVAGWNAPNTLTIARHVKPGQKIQLAIFGINGPLSDPPTNFIWMKNARVSFVRGAQAPLAVPPQEVNVRVVRKDPALDAIVPPNPKLFKLAEGFLFTEGPVWKRDESLLLFSDPNANRIYAYDASGAGSLALYRPNSGYDGADIAEYGQPGSNGLTFDARGRLTINQHGNHRLVRVEQDGALTVLADRYAGKRLNSPNDLVYKSNGAVYFTDPPFGLPKLYDDPRKELAFSGVYRARDGKTTLLSDELKGPNGIAFSPDEKYLYVGNWDAQRKVVLRYPVKRDGTLGRSENFIDVTAEIPGEEALDGIKVDKLGNVYLAAPDGLRIYSSAGTHLGTIIAPRPIHNFAWGDEDGKTLYLTARDRLYRIALTVEGVRP